MEVLNSFIDAEIKLKRTSRKIGAKLSAIVIWSFALIVVLCGVLSLFSKKFSDKAVQVLGIAWVAFFFGSFLLWLVIYLSHKTVVFAIKRFKVVKEKIAVHEIGHLIVCEYYHPGRTQQVMINSTSKTVDEGLWGIIRISDYDSLLTELKAEWVNKYNDFINDKEIEFENVLNLIFEKLNLRFRIKAIDSVKARVNIESAEDVEKEICSLIAGNLAEMYFIDLEEYRNLTFEQIVTEFHYMIASAKDPKSDEYKLKEWFNSPFFDGFDKWEVLRECIKAAGDILNERKFALIELKKLLIKKKKLRKKHFNRVLLKL